MDKLLDHGVSYSYSDFYRSALRHRQSLGNLGLSLPSKATPVEIFTPLTVGSTFTYEVLIQLHELRELLPGVACADAEPDSLQLRAALARAVVKDEGVLALDTALWFYRGGPLPNKLTVYYLPYEKRPQSKILRGLRKRFYPGDVLTIHGVRVMKPEHVQRALGLDQEILAPVIR